MESTAPVLTRSPGRHALASAAIALVVAAFLVVGALGVYRYARGYWLYRGFPAPRDPAGIPVGTTEHLKVTSAALGGRTQDVSVYLPPGYSSSRARRYPVFYLLHGFPGRPSGFLLALRVGVLEDVYLARHHIRPLILAMPFGSTGSFTDKEWANGVRPHEAWETFVAHDVVHAVDARYRTIRSGRGRALGGLSEGGYAALNIGLHHPGEFHVLESWSGYERADNLKSIFAGKPALLARNSPLHELGRAAAALRREHTFVWFYSSSKDRLRKQNEKFEHLLLRARIAHRFFIVKGGHNFAVWRAETGPALIAAAGRIGRR